MREEANIYKEEFLAKDHPQDSPENMYSDFSSNIQKVMDKHIPTKIVRGNKDRQWVSVHTKKLIKRRDKMCGKARSGNTRAKSKFKSIKHLIQKKIREDYNKYVNSIITDNEDSYSTQANNSSSKKFWSFVKSLKRDNTGVAPLKENGILTSDPTEKAEILNKQYQSVFTHDNEVKSDDLPAPTSQLPDIDPIIITLEGVVKLLQHLNPSKASGPDAIPPSALKELAVEIAPILQVIFQQSLDTGSLPSEWLNANISTMCSGTLNVYTRMV